MTEAKNVAFLGMGVMGAPMAGHLARAGHKVTVYNRTAAKAEEWAQARRAEGLEVAVAASAAEAAKGQDVVLSCLGNDDDLASVILGGSGALAAMDSGALFIDHTTVSPAIARRIAAEAEALGIAAVDAPISGGQEGAENGKLSIMCGGTAQAVGRAELLMRAYAQRIVHIGDAGAGQAAKAVNQVCIAGIMGGLSEGLRLAQYSGLDMDKVYEAISGGAAQSTLMDNRWATMVKGEFDFGFAIDWMRKDLAIALGEASSSGLPMPATQLVDRLFEEVQQLGGNRQDTSALVRHLPEPEA